MYRARPKDGVAWVTGASVGIGRALALRLAHAGFHVAVTARRADVLAELEEAGDARISAFPGDVTDLSQMREIVGAIEAKLGSIALAVLNAGVYDQAERRRFDADVALRTLDVNLGGIVRCIDPVLAVMLPRHRGQIVMIASLAGYGGIPGSAAYGASKAGLINFAEAMRLTYARSGLAMQVVNPGFVATAMTASNDYPMPLMMSPENAAEHIVAGMQRGGFEITFPLRLAWLAKAASLLPYGLWLPLMARATRRTKSSRRLNPRGD